MRIYVAHSTNTDYENEIYKPLRGDSFFLRHKLCLPHENNMNISNSREDYRGYDIVIAECSNPSTGMGIELGWFYDEKKPIYCFYREGTKPSNAVKTISEQMIEYKNSQDFVNKIKDVIEVL